MRLEKRVKVVNKREVGVGREWVIIMLEQGKSKD